MEARECHQQPQTKVRMNLECAHDVVISTGLLAFIFLFRRSFTVKED